MEQTPETSKLVEGSNNNETKEQEAKSFDRKLIPKPDVVPPPTIKTKKSVKRKRKTTEQKIEEAERYRDRCIERIKIMEEKELDDDDDGVTLETIDKLRKKVMEFEEVICAYYESEFDCKDPKSSNIFSKIFITSTGLEPLNQFLTELVGDVVTKEHMCAGYRCVTFDDVDGKIKEITETNECSIIGMVVPSDETKREEFIISIVDSVNSHCRKLRCAEFFAEQEANQAENNPEMANGIIINNTGPVLEPVSNANDDAVDHFLDVSLNAVLLNMKKEGGFEVGDFEVPDCIDLNKEGSDEDEEVENGNQNGSEEEDKQKEDAKDDATSDADIQELLSQPVPNIGEEYEPKTPALVVEDGCAKKDGSQVIADSSNILRSDCIISEDNSVEEIQRPVRGRSIETVQIDDSEPEEANGTDDDDDIEIIFQHTNSR